MEMFLSVVLLLLSIAITVGVILMESKQEGLGVIGGGGNIQGQSSMSKDKILNRVILGSAVLFILTALIIAIIS